MKTKRTVIFALALLAVGFTAMAQSITMNLSNVSVKSAMAQLEKQGAYSFVYKVGDVDTDKTVSVNATTLTDALNQIFYGQNVSFDILGNKIVITKGRQADQRPGSVKRNISGMVVDNTGAPAIGAYVLEKGTKNGAIVDLDGHFALSVQPGATLLVSCLGFVAQEIPVGSQTSFNITIQEETENLDEVVVVGYGAMRKGNVTGSIATVKNDAITKAPAASTINTLGGRLPGLITKQESGRPGADQAAIRIRGFDNAIWIVDGVEMNFNLVDASQIESISILKDASASIYGSRAGNGVVLVTTKRGIAQKPTISVNSSLTMQGLTRFQKMVSSGEYATLQNELWLSEGHSADTKPFTDEQVRKYYDGGDPQYPNTDWFDYLVRDWAPLNQHNISVRGGSEKIKYFGFLGYMGQESMWKYNGGNFKRFNLQSNIDASITDRLSFQFDLSAIKSWNKSTSRPQNAGGNTVWQDLWSTLPIYPATLPDPTKLSYGGVPNSAHTQSNRDLAGYNDNFGMILNGTASLKYIFKHVKGLTAKYLVNYYEDQSDVKNYARPVDLYTYDVLSGIYTLRASLGSAAQMEVSHSLSRKFMTQASLNYDNRFGTDHALSALALFETIDYYSNWLSASRDGFITPAIEQLFGGSTDTMKNNGSANEMGRMSAVGRVNYSFKDRYLIETTFRADASAKFSPRRRWGFFPSVSLGWRISEEPWMEGTKDVLDALKLRASYGQSGNDGVVNFQYLSGYQLGGYYLLGSESRKGLLSTGMANPDLTWEEISIYDAGLEWSFLNRSFYGEIDGFYRTRDGIPGTRLHTLPSTFGASLPQENINSLNNRGFELSLGSSKTFGKFSYDINANLSWSRAKWDHYEEQEYEDPDEIRLYKRSGQWVDRTIGYKTDGLFTSQAEIDALPYDQDNKGNTSLRPGTVKIVDVNGDGKIDWKDQVEIGKGTMPHWMTGVSIDLRYGDFDLSALFQGAFGYSTNIGFESISKDYFDLRWTEENNDKWAQPRIGAGSTGDFNLKQAGYLRLKQLTFGYNLPKSLCEKLALQRCRLYLAGTNLLTFDKLSKFHVDPEAPSGANTRYYPQQKTVSVGLNVSF